MSSSQSSLVGLLPQPKTYAPSFPVPNGNMTKLIFPLERLVSTSIDVLKNLSVVDKEPSPPIIATIFLVDASFSLEA